MRAATGGQTARATPRPRGEEATAVLMSPRRPSSLPQVCKREPRPNIRDPYRHDLGSGR